MVKYTNMPLLSVVMPVYNAERFVEEAIKSILRQTFTDFEFIIIDDGSTDKTFEVISSFSDKRIITKQLTINKGFIASLEHGIYKASGKWIARMDADDLSSPDRFAVEIEFLNKHPNCVFIGSTYHVLSPAGKILKRLTIPSNGWKLLNREILTLGERKFADPTTIFNRKQAIIVGLYDHDIKYEAPLWYKLLEVGNGIELYKPLHLYRIHLDSNTNKPQKDPRTLMYKNARKRYDPNNAKNYIHWDEVNWIKPKDIRVLNIIKAMRMCHVTGDRQIAWKIFKEIQPEFSLDPILLKILIKGVLGIRNLSPFTPRNREQYEEIKLDWYQEKI